MSAPRLALPQRCAVCAAWAGQAVCADCRQRFATPCPRCPRCALALPSTALCGACLRDPPPYARAVSVADYGFPWDRLVSRFKFHQHCELAAALAMLMAGAVRAQSDLPTPDLLVPVPLAPRRLAERGYNQAWELAWRLARRLERPAQAQTLLRLHDTPHQTGLTRAERARNLRGAFWVPPDAATALHGRTVALVDDVLTTGATAALASRALLDAGAAQVQLWVFLRTPPPGD